MPSKKDRGERTKPKIQNPEAQRVKGGRSDLQPPFVGAAATSLLLSTSVSDFPSSSHINTYPISIHSPYLLSRPILTIAVVVALFTVPCSTALDEC
jgi:hypothetical protein